VTKLFLSTELFFYPSLNKSKEKSIFGITYELFKTTAFKFSIKIFEIEIYDFFLTDYEIAVDI